MSAQIIRPAAATVLETSDVRTLLRLDDPLALAVGGRVMVYGGRSARGNDIVAAGIVVASLVVGSSLIIQTGRGPLVWGVPMLGLLGFGFAALFGIWLVISILRSGRI